MMEYGTAIAAITIYVPIAANDTSFHSHHPNHHYNLFMIKDEKGKGNRY
jgi:hypothetical protein